MGKENNALFYFALVLLAVSLVVFGLNIQKLTKITGQASSAGTANLTVETLTSINFTTRIINWSSGSVSSGSTNATLDTSAGSVTNGNWTTNSVGLRLENIGNTNTSLDIAAGKTAGSFVGGTNPLYRYNVTDVEVGGCVNASGFDEGAFYTVNTTSPGTRVCSTFPFGNSYDAIRIDIYLVVPYDSSTGALGDTITATATAFD